MVWFSGRDEAKQKTAMGDFGGVHTMHSSPTLLPFLPFSPSSSLITSMGLTGFGGWPSAFCFFGGGGVGPFCIGVGGGVGGREGFVPFIPTMRKFSDDIWGALFVVPFCWGGERGGGREREG